MLENINKIVKEVSIMLNIKEPIIKYDTSSFESNTQFASANVKDYIIYLNDKMPNELDIYFAVAHEMRHLWQYQNESWRDTITKHRSNSKLSTQEYNSQAEEVDANAFATYFMINNFNVRPLFNGFNSKMKRKTLNRYFQIKKELDHID